MREKYFGKLEEYAFKALEVLLKAILKLFSGICDHAETQVREKVERTFVFAC